MLLTLLIVFVSAILILLFQYHRQRSSDEYLEKEYHKRNIPFYRLDNVVLNLFLDKRPDLELDRVIRTNKEKIFGINDFGGLVTVVVAVPELIQLILSKEFTNFVNRRKPTNVGALFSKILFFSEDEAWKRIRSIIAPTFSAKKLRRMIPQIEETTETLLKNLKLTVEKEKLVDIKRLAGAFTMDTIVKTAFGVEIDSLDNVDNPLVNSARQIFAPDLNLFKKIQQAIFFYFPLIRKLYSRLNPNSPNKTFENYSKMIIQQKRKKFSGNNNQNIKASDFIELMLEAEKNDFSESIHETESVLSDDKKFKKYITEDEIIAQCMLFFLAGYDTTATTLTLSMFNLAAFPDKQEKLYQEIIKINSEPDPTDGTENEDAEENGSLTTEKLAKYEYLEAVINETLRLFPVLPAIERRAAQDIHLETEDGKYRLDLKKDDIVRIPIYSLHHDPDVWDEPYQFKPERFLSGQSTHHKYAHIPFGSGPRICIGKALGLTEAKIALMNIVQRYRMKLSPDSAVPPKFSSRPGLLSPFNIMLKFESRSI